MAYSQGGKKILKFTIDNCLFSLFLSSFLKEEMDDELMTSLSSESLKKNPENFLMFVGE